MQIEEEPEPLTTEQIEAIQEEDEELSALQLKERNERTIFVGNVDLDLDKKHLQKHFKECGKIEKIWFRSVPVEEGKIPTKAAVIMKKYAKDAAGKNAYVLFSTKEEAEKALDLNGSKIQNNTLRVDTAIRKQFDYTKTIFIGNLPFNATEEELRTFFSDCGKMDNVRIVRDSATHVGKGIAYITFKDLLGFKAGLKKNNSTFKERELRIKKAAPTARVEKKQLKKKTQTQTNAERRLERKQNQEIRKEALKPQDMKALLDNAEIKEANVEDLNLENEIRSSGSILKKRIKKIQRKTGEDKFAVHLKESKRAKDKINKEYFNGINERKKRKEYLKKKALVNKKQVNKQRILLKGK